MPCPRFAARCTHPVATRFVISALLAFTAPSAWSDTYVIPHVLEQQGTTASTTYHFDHTLFAFYGTGLVGTPGGAGATLDLYLYDNSAGNPLQTFGNIVCNPCSFALGVATPRAATIRIEDLINASGGFDASIKLGFGVIVAS